MLNPKHLGNRAGIASSILLDDLYSIHLCYVLDHQSILFNPVIGLRGS